MLSTPASRLRALAAAICLSTSSVAGADGTILQPGLIDEPAVHATPRGDTPHDSFAAAETALRCAATA